MAAPGKELVGKNARLNFIGNYSDDYLTALNQYASVVEVMGKSKQEVAEGGTGAAVWRVVAGIDRTESAMSSINEITLVELLALAARKSEWKAIRQKYPDDAGVKLAVEGGYAHLTYFKSKAFLMPSAMLTEYCQMRF